MGEKDVSSALSDRELQRFEKALLDDVHALELMLKGDLFETGIRRIGAEQEMFLVDDRMYPAPVAPQVLERIDDPRMTTELARFNLEANLSPQVFGGRCLSELEHEAEELLASAAKAARECGADVLLAGILPSLRLSDCRLENMSPAPRYKRLNDAFMRMRKGAAIHVVIKGLDELDVTHGNVLLEAGNTSFQIHFQVAPDEFAPLYNIAQTVTGPVLAAAVNSPLLLGRRLWKETRVALFQHSVDSRSRTSHERGHGPRVSFGDRWVRRSILELFRDDISRFRVVVAADSSECSTEMLERGEIPSLHALRLHNSTVWRWNRACYGVSGGKAHLRIENRVLPAGPTVADEVANAALFFGLMAAFAEEYRDITQVIQFDDVKTNFFAAARHGLEAQMTWFGGKQIAAPQLILDELLPLAHAGLRHVGIDVNDRERYLGIIEERVKSNQTGANWMLKSLAELSEVATADIRHRTITAAILDRQRRGTPVHEWPLVDPSEVEDWGQSFQTVGQFMSRNLFTVRPEDLVDFAASMMDWEHIRHVPVEDDGGRLVGLVSHRALLRLVARGRNRDETEPVTVRSIMNTEPVTVSPDTSTLEAIAVMRDNRLGCLPIVETGRLVGIVTEHDFLEVAAQLFEAHLKIR